jgi:uncharacterized RDD family membrane protein YckC
MGNYIPAGPPQKRTINDTLLESEYEHYLDCPTADPVTRFAACFLDFILCSLAWSATNHLSEAGAAAAASLTTTGSLAEGWMPPGWVYGLWVLRISLLYLYFIWAVASYGGTPAKLLLGLRVLDVKQGNRLSLPRAMFRELILKTLSAASVIGVAMALFRPDRRALHDLIAGTVVKKIRGEP